MLFAGISTIPLQETPGEWCLLGIILMALVLLALWGAASQGGGGGGN